MLEENFLQTKLLSDVSHIVECVTHIAAVFVADSVVFHWLPRLFDHLRNRPRSSISIPLCDLLRFVFNGVATVWVFWVWQQHHESLTPTLTAAAAWIVFRTVSNCFSLTLSPRDRINESLRQQGSDESKGRGLAWNYWTGFLEKFCCAVSKTNKLLLIPSSLLSPDYNKWDSISYVEELKFSATGDMTKDQRRPIKVKVYRIKCPANGKDYDFIPDFPQILKSFEGRNKDMDNAAREVVLRSFKQEIRRLMVCKRRQNPGTQIPLIVEYDDREPLPEVLNQYFMRASNIEEH